MAQNKLAQIRYHVLDRCFRNTFKQFYIENLLEECNNVLHEYNSEVSRRQLLDDIAFMETFHLWQCKIVRTRNGKRVWFRYSDPNYSITNCPFTESELSKFDEVLHLLKRFDGLPQFKWLQDFALQYKSYRKMKEQQCSEVPSFVIYDQNPFYKGFDHIATLFDAIYNKQVLRIEYSNFAVAQKIYAIPEKCILHPYFIKQYNHRWYVIGYVEELNDIINLAIDRIESFDEDSQLIYKSTDIDPDDYYQDIIGVTRLNAPCRKVRLWIKSERFPYIETKPFHGSQRLKNRTEEGVEIELELIPNFELEMLILSFGSDIKVLSPASLRQRIKSIAEGIISHYQ